MDNKQLRLKCWVQDQDLRLITHVRLAERAADLRLKDGEAALFTNSTMSRARMILISDGLPLLLLFPADEGYQVMSEVMRASVAWIVANCGGREAAKAARAASVDLAALGGRYTMAA